MSTNLSDLRACYAAARAELARGLSVDHSDIEARIGLTPRGEVRDRAAAAFEALFGWAPGTMEARIARTIETMRRGEEKVHAGFRADARRRAQAKAREERREAARLARETAATITEW